MPDWTEFERRHVWHPYASMLHPVPAYPVRRAEGVYLELYDGRRLIDGMASWWSAIHGYRVPELDAAIERQLRSMAHVMFGGLTHEPAARLAARLLELAPSSMRHVFFADSGSVAVEVAIKMALQFWQAQGQSDKRRLLTIRGGYHGDTFAAMSVCDPEQGMHHLFHGMLPRQYFIDAPDIPPGAPWDETQMQPLRQMLERHHRDIAAMILEPVVQGAGGMRFYHPHFLQQAARLCREYEVLLIVDEIATGFGRTGRMFAQQHAQVEADIICVGKALTGGYMTLAATLCSREIAEGLHGTGAHAAGVLMHGPTFMANPLACAVADASLRLLCQSPWRQRVARIERCFADGLAPCRALPGVREVRVFGAIGVLEMHKPVDVARVQASLVEQGVWLRPFGRLIYAMPPYVIGEEELERLVQAMYRAACL